MQPTVNSRPISHVVTIAAKTFYHVYVEDEQGNMSQEDILAKAKENLLNNDPAALIDPEIDMEPQDIIGATYSYPIYD